MSKFGDLLEANRKQAYDGSSGTGNMTTTPAPSKPDSATAEKKTPWEILKETPLEDIVSDIGGSLWDWAKGAIQGWNEVVRANDYANESGANLAAYENPFGTEGLTEEQQRALKWHKDASDMFVNQTLRPASLAISTAAIIPELAVGAGALTVTAGTGALLGGASASYLPFMIHDIGESIAKQGVASTAKNLGLGLIPGYSAYQELNNPEASEEAKAHPGRAALSSFGTALASLAPLARPIGKGIGKIIHKADITTDPIHPLDAAIIEESRLNKELKGNLEEAKTTATANEANLKAALEEAADKIKEDKPHAATPAEKLEKIAKGTDDMSNVLKAEEVKTPEEQTFMRGGKEIPIGKSNLKEPVKIQSIWDTLNQIVTARKGHLILNDKSVLGYFEPKSEGVRARGQIDFGTLSHEMGHFLDKKLDIRSKHVVDKAAMDKELIEGHLTKYNGESPYPAGQYVAEGIAEFTEQYIMNPDVARQNFPNYAKHFETELARDPALQQKVDLIGNQIRQWYNQDPIARANGAIFTPDGDTNFKTSISNWIKDFKSNWTDSGNIFKSITDEAEDVMGKKLMFSDNPYYMYRGMHNLASAAIQILTGKTAAPEWMKALRERFGQDTLPYDVLLGDVYKPLSDPKLIDTYKDFFDRMGAKSTKEAFETYLTARHAVEVRDVMTKRKVDALAPQVAELRKKIATMVDGAEKNKLIQELQKQEQQLVHLLADGDTDYKLPMTYEEAKAVVGQAPTPFAVAGLKWDQFNANFLSLAQKYGLVSAEEVRYLKDTYPHYSPLKRVFEADKTPDLTYSMNPDGKLVNLQKLYRSLSETGSDRLVKDPIIEMNHMVERMVKMGEKNKVARAIIDLGAKVDGMSQYYMKANQMSQNPKDLIFSVWRDGKEEKWQATDPYLYNILQQNNPAKARADFTTILQLSASTLRTGATATPGFWARQFIMDSFTAAISHQTKGIVIPLLDTINGLLSMRDKNMYARFAAQGVPMATYTNQSKMLDRAIRASMGETKTAQVLNGLKIKNGTAINIAQGISDLMSKLYEGGTRIGEAVEEAPRFMEFKRAIKEGKTDFEAGHLARELTVDFSKMGLKGQQLNQVTAFFNASLQGNLKVLNLVSDPKTRLSTLCRVAEYIIAPSVTLWMLNHNEDWYHKLPMDIKNRYWVMKAGDMIYKFPKPELWGIFGSTMERALDFYGDHNTNVPPTMAPYVNGLVMPNLIPTGLTPFFELWANKSFFTDSKIVPPRLEGEAPEDQYDNKTSEIGKAIGGAIKYPPMKIDHFVNSTTGTLGKSFLEGMDMLILGDNMNRPAKKTEDMWFANRFTVDPLHRPEPINVFFDKVDEMSRQWKHDNKDIPAKKRKKTAELKGMEKAKKNIMDSYKEIRVIESDTKLSPEEKLRQADLKRKDIIKLADDANKKFTDYKY